jgi:hypothetical protein
MAREYLAWFQGDDDPRLYSYILTFLQFCKKGVFKDKDLTSNAFRKWCEIEEHLATIDLDGKPLIDVMRRLAKYYLRAYHIEEFYPKHGNGSVAERGVHGVSEKNAKIAFSSAIIRTYYNRYDNIYDDPCTLFPDNMRAYPIKNDQAARLEFVPKNYKTMRSICMEPIVYQYTQQGVLKTLVDFLDSDGAFGNTIDLHDQTKNQMAAQFGSYTGLLDTIDLSSASDCVLLDLVKKVFPPQLLRHLLATRSPLVTISGDLNGTGKDLVRSVRKYAPMGSALCFPVQCMIYSIVVSAVGLITSYNRDVNDSGICEYLSKLTDHELDTLLRSTFTNSYKRDAQNRYINHSIYGDDICLDHRLTSQTIAALESLGFIVNRDKTFVNCESFRESCGKFYLRGHDISFLLYSVNDLGEWGRTNISVLPSIVDFVNRCNNFGYRNLRKLYIRYSLRIKFGKLAQNEGVNPILFTHDPDETCAILIDDSKPVINSHLRHREWRFSPSSTSASKFQRDECESITLEPLVKSQWNAKEDYYLLGQWWRSHVSEKETACSTLFQDVVPTGKAALRYDTRYLKPRLRWTCRPL